MAPKRKAEGPLPEDDESPKQHRTDDDLESLEEDVESLVDNADEVDPALENKCGTLLQIHVENFMCHDNFKMSFGDKITFISGDNGSGKSAVVAAVQVCFGATARETGRGSKMEELVQRGQYEAVCRVVISNDGPDAYKPDLFGDSIMVERKFNVNGTSSYALYAAPAKQLFEEEKVDEAGMIDYQGKRIPKHGTDAVNEIKERFHLFVSNACCVLRQSAAKKFLTGTSKDKYRMFVESTDLDATEERLEKVQLERDATKREFEQAKITLRLHDKDVKTKTDVVEQFATADTLQDQIENLERAVELRAVMEQEKAAASRLKQLEKGKALLEKSEARLKVLCSKYDALYEQVDSNAQEESVKSKELSSLRIERDSLKDAIKKLVKELAKIDKKMATREKSRAGYQNKLEEALEEAKLAESNKFKELNDELSTLEKQKMKLDAMVDEESAKIVPFKNENKLLAMEAEVRERETKIVNKKTDVARSKQNVSFQERELESYQKGKSKRKNVNVQVPLEISKAMLNKKLIGAFNVKPKPVWEHVDLSLKACAYSGAIARIFGPNLFNLLYDPKHDEQAMRALMNAHPKVKGVAMEFDREKIAPRAQNPFPKEIVSLMDELVVTDDDVNNYLVDILKLWTVALVPNTTKLDKEKVCKKSVGGRINLVQPFFCVYDQQATCVRVTREGAMLTTPISIEEFNRLDARISVTSADKASEKIRIESLIRKYEKEIIDRTEDLRELELKLESARLKLEEIQYEEKRHQIVMGEIKAEINRLDANRDVLDVRKRKVEEEILQGNSMVLKWQSQIKEKQNEIDELLEEKMALESEKSSKEVEAEELCEKISALEREGVMADDEEDSLEQLEDLVKEKTSLEHTCSEETKRLTSLENEVKEESVYVSSKKQAVMDSVPDDLKEVVLELATGDKSSMELAKTKELLQRKLASELMRAQESGDDPAAYKARIKAELAEATKTRDDFRRAMDTVKARLPSLKKTVEQRKKKFEDLREKIQARTCSWFRYYLAKRGSDGEIAFDNVEKTLDISWKRVSHARTSANNSVVTDLSKLSGGEKSMASVCLLLAIGRNVSTPFRIFDEYDVYMDEEARHIATSVMIEAARDAANIEDVASQFIFLTPHDVKRWANTASASEQVGKLDDLDFQEIKNRASEE